MSHILSLPDLEFIKKSVYDKYSWTFTNFQLNKEGKEYSAASFELNGKHIHYRSSKITPTKVGQFVTVWKRNSRGITQPYDSSDNFDFIIIFCQESEKSGQFIFPKSVLEAQGIISKNDKGGKRGIRVYPPWVITTNKQAAKTQDLQKDYFLSIESDGSVDLDLAKKLFV